MDDRNGLLLSRKKGQTVQIGNNIIVEVKAIKGNRVQLRFAASPELPILRGELKFRNVPIGGEGRLHG